MSNQRLRCSLFTVFVGQCLLWPTVRPYIEEEKPLDPLLSHRHSEEVYRDSQEVAQYLEKNTSPSDSIFLYRNKMLNIYYLSERFPPIKPFMYNQLLAVDGDTNNRMADAEELLKDSLQRLTKNMPVFIVVGCSRWIIPEIDRFIEEFYELDFVQGIHSVYKRKNDVIP
jgi:hypothetical protein